MLSSLVTRRLKSLLDEVGEADLAAWEERAHSLALSLAKAVFLSLRVGAVLFEGNALKALS